MSDVCLHGFGPSVYTWAARLALQVKGVAFRHAEITPFDTVDADRLARLHPFGRVPVLGHQGRLIYETAAILAYVDAAFDGPSLTPADPLGRARAVQVGAIVDSYAYWPLVRQVYSHAVFRPAIGMESDPEVVAAGLQDSAPVLAALEQIAQEGTVLHSDALGTADCHLYPMIASFHAAEAGAALLEQYPALSRWRARLADLPRVVASAPDPI